MKNKVKELLMPVIVLTLIAAVMAALLGGTNLLTKGQIALLSKQAKEQAVKQVIKADKYEDAKINYNGTNYDYIVAKTADKTVGYAFTLSSNGYGGAVESVIGIDVSGEITAVEITDVSGETPGLGQNAANENFYGQFAGKKGSVEVVKSGAKENQINAVTGATITSKAVTNSVNLATELYNEITKKGE